MHQRRDWLQGSAGNVCPPRLPGRWHEGPEGTSRPARWTEQCPPRSLGRWTAGPGGDSGYVLPACRGGGPKGRRGRPGGAPAPLIGRLEIQPRHPVHPRLKDVCPPRSPGRWRPQSAGGDVQAAHSAANRAWLEIQPWHPVHPRPKEVCPPRSPGRWRAKPAGGDVQAAHSVANRAPARDPTPEPRASRGCRRSHHRGERRARRGAR